MMKVTCSALAIAAGLVAGTPAMAQQTEPAPAQQPATEDFEIVVTAQFKEQRVQDIPIAVSALNSETLDQKGVADVAGAANLAPNVQLSSSAGNFGGMAAVFIRGVGQSDPYPALEPGVGMYIDEVYYGVLAGSVLDLVDVERVEVLRGPQGTLAGKNSLGGSIRIFSKRPGPTSDAFVEAGYGSRNSMSLRAATNVTLQEDKLFARISVGAKHSDGYVDQLDYACATGNFTGGTRRQGTGCKIGEQGGQRVFSGRLSLLWQPSGAIENLFVIDATRDRSQNPAIKTILQSPAWAAGNNYITGPESYTNYENYIARPTGGSSAGVPFFMPDITPVDAWGIANNLNVDLADNLKLTSITGYRKSNSVLSTVIDGTPASILDQVWRLDHEQFTQELRLSGTVGGFLEWTLGGYYYHADGISTARVNIAGGVAPGGGGANLDLLTYDIAKTESKSVFLHTIWGLAEGLNVTAAARYTSDAKDYTFNRLDPNGAPHPVLGALRNVTIPFRGNRFDYRLGVDYKWSPGLMTYAQVSTGYKGGGVNPRPYSIAQALTFQPETLTAYEAGIKSQFADRRVTFNVAAFLNDYSNFQAFLVTCPSSAPPANPCALTTNVGDARVKGIEGELVFEPVDGLTIDGSVGYLDFKYKRVTAATGITKSMTNVFTPEWSGNAGIQYDADLGKAGILKPRIDYNYRSSIQTEAVNSAISTVAGRGLFNAKLTWVSADEDWQAALSVANLANKFYYNAKFVRPVAPYFSGVGVVGMPRTFMFTVKRNFK